MKIIIVESPSKSHTIKNYLGKDYEVLSSKGHITELATTGHGGLGIDIEGGFIPKYKILPDKVKLVEELKKACFGNEVYLATDPDREGEAIAYHLAKELNLDLNDNNRIEFHEITKKAVQKALENPHKIDLNLVESQETRRMIDRILGFKLSKLLKRKINSDSAGRVQSAVLKLAVDLEDEIKAFVPVKYYEMEAYINNTKLKLVSLFDNKIDSKNRITDRKVLENLKNRLLSFRVSDIQAKEVIKKSKPVYTTSTLQQDAVNRLGFTPATTMRYAQGLYEGKKIGSSFIGLITYMRTDSTRISDDFVDEADKYILEHFGSHYLGMVKSKNQAGMQDAHEGIRPTSIENTPEMVKPYLTNSEYKLYELIYKRALASLMSDAVYTQTKVTFTNVDSEFEATGLELKFDGYRKLYNDKTKDEEDNLMPSFKLGECYNAKEIEILDKETEPKSRYTEATLIKDMETLGIGRPSTYAQTVDTLLKRKYVELDKKNLVPTEQGDLTSKSLDEYFSSMINVKYTAQMESDLDLIAKGEKSKLAEMNEFYNAFVPLFDNAVENMEKRYPIQTDEICPICGNNLVIRLGKYGEFTACSNYPECTFIKKELDDNKDTGVICPVCGSGHMIERYNAKTKQVYYSCNNYPECKTIYNDLPTDDICPNCGAVMLVDKDGNKYCSDKCFEHTDILCPKCNKEFLTLKTAKRGKHKNNRFYVCPSKECGFIGNDEAVEETCPICGARMFIDKDKNIYCINHDTRSSKPVEEKPEVHYEMKDGNIICPKCGKGTLVKRVAKKGANSGKEFYACNNFPKCKNLVSLEEYNEIIKNFK